MELLRVKENIEGWISVKGRIKGPLRNVEAVGTAKLQKGRLFGVDIDSLACGVSYAKGVMKFVEGSGSIYRGKAKFEALIHLPVVDFYSFSADLENIDSKPVFRLIGWDPGVQPGKVAGEVSTAGNRFDPSGWFRYRSADTGKDFLGRIRDISGRYAMKQGLLTLDGLKLGTGKTNMTADGTADITRKTLNLNGLLKTNDVTDVTGPYYTKLTGRGGFRGRISGSFDDPVISGNLGINNPVFGTYSADLLETAFSYRKNFLSVGEMTVKGGQDSATVSGDVSFVKATKLFDLSEPQYHLAASLKNAELGKFARVFYPGFKGTGRFDADCRIGGTAAAPEVSGNASVGKAVVYRLPFDSASFLWKYAGGRISFANMKVNLGGSSVSGIASVDADGRFSYKAYSEQLFLSDITSRPLKGDAQISLKSEGSGTFDDPSISLNARIKEGLLRGRLVGTGTVAGEIRNKKISLTSSLLDGKVNISGKGRLDGKMPWEAKIVLKPGRYDPVIGAFLQDVPEDLVLNLGGEAFARGDRTHIEASSVIRQLSLSMYGYSFTNEKEIRLALHDRDLSFDKILLRSGKTDVSIDGRLAIGKEYNIVIEGSSDLSPIKSLSKKIGFLRGDAEYVVSVTGDWDMPQVNGGVTVNNGAFSLKEYPYRLSSLKGYFFMDNDKIVMEKLSGKLGGGNITLSGIVYLKKFAVKRFYIETAMDNITAAVTSDFSVNFGGSLLYKGTPSASTTVSGDITINRARYKERVEWKSWLLKAKKSERYKAEISNMEKAELNIRIAGKDSILVDNNVARATVSADMLLRGTVFQPVLLGRLETREGTVYFRNIEFRILHASADFTDTTRVNPFVNISAETVVKDYKIKMNMDGQLDHFTMALSSEPSLKEMDILSLLAVGQTGGDLKGLEGGIGASEATSFVTGKLQDVMEERLKTITGLDRFQIDPYVSKSTGSIEPRVTVSKRLLGEKMFVTYTSSVGSSEEQIVKLEYFLSKNMSVLGVRDERGIVGGDIRFRFDFR